MSNFKRQHGGFSLTEVLMAVGTLAVGMMFIGGTFMVGIHLTMVSSEQTTAAIIADEAFAKVRLFGVNLFSPNLTVFQSVPFEFVASAVIDPNEFLYPSVRTPAQKQYLRQYFWSALCRRSEKDPAGRTAQVTIFVSRKIGSSSQYWTRDPLIRSALAQLPVPAAVPVRFVQNPLLHNIYELRIDDAVAADTVDEIRFVNDGATIVDDQTGLPYQVVERYPDKPDTIRLKTPWAGAPTGWVWLVPPPVGGGRLPCIAVYGPKEIRL